MTIINLTKMGGPPHFAWMGGPPYLAWDKSLDLLTTEKKFLAGHTIDLN